MPKRIDVPSLYRQLKERKERLEQSLKRLAGAPYVLVKYESSSTDEDLPQAFITSVVRVRQTTFRFRVWEDFRGSDDKPFLYGFTYSLEMQDPQFEPLFRYECHPDVDDPQDNDAPQEVGFRNHYSITPHFHPNKTLSHPMTKLHYPFGRGERPAVVFSLIGWIETDLVQRFYDSNPRSK